MSTMSRFIPDAECVQSKCANATTGCRDVCMMRNPGWIVAAPAEQAAPDSAMLKWALRELLTTLPKSRDWFNPDAEKVLRASLAAPLPAAPAPTEQSQRDWRVATAMRDWYLANYPETANLIEQPNIGAIIKSADLPAEQAGELPQLPEPLEINWPELHSSALGCGVEDRNIHDRYEAAEYGWQDGFEKAAECVPDAVYDADQMRDYARAAYAMGRGSAVRDYVCMNDAALAARQAPTEAPKEQIVADLHDEIMRLPLPLDINLPICSGDMLSYKLGHRDARHAAAELASAHGSAPDSRDAWKWPEFKDWIDSNRERPLSPYGWSEMAFNAGRAQEKSQ